MIRNSKKVNSKIKKKNMIKYIIQKNKYLKGGAPTRRISKKQNSKKDVVQNKQITKTPLKDLTRRQISELSKQLTEQDGYANGMWRGDHYKELITYAKQNHMDYIILINAHGSGQFKTKQQLFETTNNVLYPPLKTSEDDPMSSDSDSYSSSDNVLNGGAINFQELLRDQEIEREKKRYIQLNKYYNKDNIFMTMGSDICMSRLNPQEQLLSTGRTFEIPNHSCKKLKEQIKKYRNVRLDEPYNAYSYLNGIPNWLYEADDLSEVITYNINTTHTYTEGECFPDKDNAKTKILNLFRQTKMNPMDRRGVWLIDLIIGLGHIGKIDKDKKYLFYNMSCTPNQHESLISISHESKMEEYTWPINKNSPVKMVTNYMNTLTPTTSHSFNNIFNKQEKEAYGFKSNIDLTRTRSGSKHKHKGSKHKRSKHKISKHKISKHKISKHKRSKHKRSKHKRSKHKISKHKRSKHKRSKHKGSKHKGSISNI